MTNNRLIGASEALREIEQEIECAARSDAKVLVTGESGVGKDIVAARELFDQRFDTDGRSVTLINNPRTVLDVPLATVSNLRDTLDHIGATIYVVDDAVLIFLESHAARDSRLAPAFPPPALHGRSRLRPGHTKNEFRVKGQNSHAILCAQSGRHQTSVVGQRRRRLSARPSFDDD